MPRRSRHGERKRTINLERLSLSARARARSLEERVDRSDRPLTRGDCVAGPRPCPWVSCKWHLALDARRYVITINYALEGTPDVASREVAAGAEEIDWDRMLDTCALDVADRDGATLEEVAQRLNITRERVRQIEAVASRRARRAAEELASDEPSPRPRRHLTVVPDGPRELRSPRPSALPTNVDLLPAVGAPAVVPAAANDQAIEDEETPPPRAPLSLFLNHSRVSRVTVHEIVQRTELLVLPGQSLVSLVLPEPSDVAMPEPAAAESLEDLDATINDIAAAVEGLRDVAVMTPVSAVELGIATTLEEPPNEEARTWIAGLVDELCVGAPAALQTEEDETMRAPKTFTFAGITDTVKGWHARSGIPTATIHNRLSRGDSPSDALRPPGSPHGTAPTFQLDAPAPGPAETTQTPARHLVAALAPVVPADLTVGPVVEVPRVLAAHEAALLLTACGFEIAHMARVPAGVLILVRE